MEQLLPTREEIAKHIMQVWDGFEGTTAYDVLAKAAVCYAFLYGLQDATFLTSDKIKEDLAQLKRNRPESYLYFNKIKDYYLQWCSLVKVGVPKYLCEATDPSNSKDKETARMVSGGWKYHKDYVWNFDTALYSRQLFDIFCGGQAYHFYFKGAPQNSKAPGKKPTTVCKLRSLNVFDVAYEGRIESSMNEASLVVCQMVMKLSEAIEMFPTQKAEIKKFFADNLINDNTSITRANQFLTTAGLDSTQEMVDTLDKMDREYIFYVGLKNKSEWWPNGTKWLVIKDQVVAEEALDGGMLPIEVVSTQEIVVGQKLRIPPAWDGLPAQAAWNDLNNSLLKQAGRQADPATYRFEDTLISANGKKLDNNIILKPGGQYTIRPNQALIAQGIGPKEQIPFSPSPDNLGISPSMTVAVDNMFASLLHINPDLGQQVPAGTPAELLKTQYTVVKEKLSGIQLMFEDCVSRSWMLAATLMQSMLTPDDTFCILNAGRADTITWKKENLTEGVNHIFRSQINEPTTIEGKLQVYQTMANIFGERVFESLNSEDFARIMDQAGYSVTGTRDPESEEAESINRKIQNGEIEKGKETTYNEVTLTEWKVKGFTPLMEHNKLLRLKIHSDLKRGKDWPSLTPDRQSALDSLCREYIALLWIEQNKQGGMFGMLPRAKFDALMWEAMGVEISPKDKQIMIQAGMTYRELQVQKMEIAALNPPNPGPTTPGNENVVVPPAPETPEMQVEPTTDLTIK